MEVTKLVVNDVEIFIKDQPIGLGISKLSLDRDFQYSCVDTKIEAELKFYYASGKTEIDSEYESKGVEGSGYVIITDSCGTNAKNYQFNLDFKKYNNQGDYTTVGLIDVNSLWKLELNKDVNLTALQLLPEDFYVRNLPLTYDYASENINANIDSDTLNSDHSRVATEYYNTTPPTTPPSAPPTLPNSYKGFVYHYIMPKAGQTINELEDSEGLNADFFVIGQETYITMDIVDITGTTTNAASTYSQVEPPYLFNNALDKGDITISTNNTGININLKRNINANFELFQVNEIIAIGNKFDSPRIVIKNVINTSTSIISTLTPVIISSFVTKVYSTTQFVDKGESVWIYYEVVYRDIVLTALYTAPNWVYTLYNILQFEALEYKIENSIIATFKLTKNVSNGIVGSAWIEPYHTKTKAYNGSTMLNAIFGCDSNIASEYECYSDLWFSRGDYLRGKINAADFIIKPSEFFTELEKVVCCGLGYFYDLPDPYLRLRTVYDFYSDILVPSKYQFDYNDLIDGKIEIAPFSSPYYKEVQIGYSNSKDSPKDFCKQNNYSINNASDSIYSKVSDFIASMFIITRALRLGTEDKELEFDKNIILLSGTTDSGYNVTLSQTGGYLDDKSQISPTNYSGINRRYSTVFNLFRHLYKWGFSLFADKDKLTANKYEGNTIYDNKIRDTSGAMAATSAPNKADNYFGLSNCYLPYDNPTANDHAPMDKSLEDIYDRYIVKDLYVPTQITFKTANLSSLDLIEMRAHQYDLFSVTDGTNMYYGNLISANLEDDITEIKLLRRFKNGI